MPRQPVLVLVENEADVPKFADFVPEEAAAAAKPAAKAPAAAAAPAAAPKAAAAAPKAAAAAPAQNAAAGEGGRIFASPLAKRLAEAANVALANVTGSGPRGRITKADVDTYVANAGQASAAAPAAAAPAPAAAAAASTAAGSFTDIPLSNVRKVIASRLLESKQTVPHYYLSVDVRVDKILALRKEFNDSAEGAYKLSVNDFVVKASALALRKVPEANSSWMGTFIRKFSNVDISVAVSTPNGLITPIVFDAE